MTAKEYLRQYRMAEVKLMHRETQLTRLRETICAVGNGLADKVQTDVKDCIGGAVAGLVDLETEIRVERLNLEEFKHRIITEIHTLDKPIFVNILFKRYIECKSLWDISQELDYGYRHVKRLHGYALQEFYNKIIKPSI